MSGDVQPRKRKDKKKKKDELTLEESRGTAAALGEGDVFLHSHSDHGTGGHWCAKVIFFSLLAVLITLIGLIIIENRGLSELEANAVESRYSGILEGWIEDAPDDDHHDIHTLELKHHDDEHEEEHDHDDGFEDGGSEEDDDKSLNEDDDDNTLDEHEQQSHELDTAETEEVENGFNHHEDENLDEDDDDQYEVEEVATESPVESYFDYFFGSEKPQEDVLSKNDKDERDFEDDEDNNDNNYEDNLGNAADSNEDDNYENEFTAQNDKEESSYDNEKDYQNDNSYRRNYDDDDDYRNQNENEASSYENDNRYEDEDDNNDWELNENDDNDLESQYDSNYDNLNENFDQEEDDDHDDGDDDDAESEEVEVEKIEEEVDDQEPIDVELPPLPEEDADSADEKDDDEDSNANDDDDDDGDDDDDDDGDDNDNDGDENDNDKDDDDDDDYLEQDVIFEEPIVERIAVPAGKPYAEVDDDDSSEHTPVDTLAEEEEYERRQEELRREEAEASHVWLKLGVGAALLVATHAVIKRATSRDEVNFEETEDREDTPPTTDRRMTLITEATNDDLETQEAPISRLQRQVLQQIPQIVKSAPTPLQVSMDDDIEVEDEEQQIQEEEDEVAPTKTPEVELYSDEELEENLEPIKETLVFSAFMKKSEPVKEKELASDEDIGEEEEDDDVEIIGDEQIEDEDVEELDDEDISDVDDAELLSRLEAKYGSLSDPEKAPTMHKDGGNSVEDTWPGEPDDPFWKKEVDKAEDELEQGQWSAAIGRASSPQLAKSSRARYIAAKAYDQLAEEKRDNKILSIAINAYVELLKNSDRISDKKLLEITSRTIERMRFRGTYMSTEPIHRLLIRRFPDNVGYRNNFTVSFLMANRADLAEEVLKETLKKWPNDRVALAQYGFILKTQYNRLEDALEYLTKALENDTGPATEPRFYYHLGDTLLLLGRFDEAHEVHKRAAKNGHFLSPSQRSLYNVPRLKGKPWWNVNETPYERLAKSLEQNWRSILKEGLAAKALYEEEKEGLREKGEWSQLDLFARGSEVGGRCSRAPVTCAAVRAEPAAIGCRRGQVKFSAIEPGTHVRPHVGPTNCRLRMHLGLSNTKDTYIRVDKETRQWQEGKVFIFDDSFEHEVWHNGTGSRLVLIVDVWHPDLTPQERRTLPAI